MRMQHRALNNFVEDVTITYPNELKKKYKKSKIKCRDAWLPMGKHLSQNIYLIFDFSVLYLNGIQQNIFKGA